MDLAARVLAPQRLGVHPLRRPGGRVLLEKGLAVDAVGVAGEHHRPVLEVGEQPGCDAAVVLDQIALGEGLLRPEHLVEVGERGLDAFFARGLLDFDLEILLAGEVNGLTFFG